MQSLLMYKVKSVANARGQWGEAVPGLPTLFLGRGLWPAEGCKCKSFYPGKDAFQHESN